MWLQVREFIRSKRNKPFSFIVNNIGMSLAFTALIILFTYVRAELNHDSDVKHRADIVLAKNWDWGITPPAMGPWFKMNFPEVRQFCRVGRRNQAVYVPAQTGVEELYTQVSLVVADSTYPEVFSLRFTEGNADGGLVTADQVFVSEDMGKKLFGEMDPMGKQLVIGDELKVTVTGVFKDVVNPGLRKPRMIINIDFINRLWGKGETEHWGGSNYETYLQLVADTDRAALTLKYKDLYAQQLRTLGWEEEYIKESVGNAELINYNDLYFTPMIDLSHHGNRSNIDVLILIAVLVLVVSIINYVNIATARLADKSRVIGVKRTLGAGRSSLIAGIVIDSLVTCFLSMLIALGIASAIFPYLSDWLGCGKVLHIDWLGGVVLFAVVPLICGILSGIFPAFYLTRMNRLEGMNTQRNESIALQRMKSWLMVVQFVVSLGLIISTLLINKQVNYMKNMDVGYNRENVVVVKGHGAKVLLEKFPEFRNLLLQNTVIEQVAAAKEPIYDIVERGPYPIVPGTGEYVNSNVTWIDEHFLDLMGIRIIEGEGYREGGNNDGKFIINQQMAKKIASLSPDRSYLSDRQIGVMNDFNFKPLNEAIAPVCFGYLWQRAADAYIRIKPGYRQEALSYIEKCYKQVYPQTYYDYSFMEDDYIRLYGDEDLFAHRLLAFTGMSILIACLGLLAFVAFFIEQKTKSIGVRKVMGATELQILELLNRDFIRRLVIAFVIVCPFVYYIVHLWLDNFAYKTSLNWWIFVLAFIIMLSVAFLCVSILTWRAATANPVDALKRE